MGRKQFGSYLRISHYGEGLRRHRSHSVSTHQDGPLRADTADGNHRGLGKKYHQGRE